MPEADNNMTQGQPQTMPQQPQMPPPPRMVLPRKRTWQERLLGGLEVLQLTKKAQLTMPNWIIGKSVTFFFLAFVLCTLVFGHPMEARYAIISSLSVLLFFYGAKAMSTNWARAKGRVFIRNVFIVGFVIRLLWVLYCYFIFNPDYHGTTYGQPEDVEWYMPYGEAIAGWLLDENKIPFSQLMKSWGGGIDDVGYPIWLAIIHILTSGESDVFVPFLFKCLFNAWCAVCIYHVAKRHFDEGAARLGALFVALNPCMIYWCGNMLKETEMVFLCCLCVDLVDRTFTSGNKLTFMSLLPGMLAGSALFFFRAPLAVVIFLAMASHIVMASKRVMSQGKKVLAGIMVAAVLVLGMGDRLLTQAEKLTQAVRSDAQKNNMEWRSRRAGGNEFAKYAGAVVFAPLIFTIPFPTFNVAHEGQILQRQLSGGYYIKNIFSFFVIWIFLVMLITGEWRQHVFILAYTCGYLASLVLSEFAQSGRFHVPVWPMIMLFAAYGIQVAKTKPRIRSAFMWALAIEVVACLAWNWFKLKGRGMI